MGFRFLLISIFALTGVFSSFEMTGQVSSADTLNVITEEIAEEDVYPSFVEKMDSIYSRWYVDKNNKEFPDEEFVLKNRKDKVKFSDSVYLHRLDEMNSAIQLSYNKIVRNYIELYTLRRREQMSKMLGLAEYYFPIFEEILDANDLPLELKYLPVIESALNPRAFSRAGACGLWQFMYGTARMYNLKVDSYIDERRDPLKSSVAAVQYLKDMYKVYNDWILVIAAYNCGPGNVNKAIRRSGGKKSYWDIYYRLPKETRGYVPAFIGAMYAFNYHKEHNIYPERSDYPILCDTVMMQNKLHFNQISEILGVPVEQLRDLNPQYRRDIVPATVKRPLAVNLPCDNVGDFIENADTILAHERTKYFDNRDRIVNPRDREQRYAHAAPSNRAKVYYKVKRGDAVSLIADWFNVRTADLRYWNNIRRNIIKVGQRLVVYVPKEYASYYKKFNSMSYSQKQALRNSKPIAQSVDNSSVTDGSGDYIYYRVRRGDNLWSIAKKFPGVSNKDIMRWNNIRNAKSIRPGRKLKIKKV